MVRGKFLALLAFLSVLFALPAAAQEGASAPRPLVYSHAIDFLDNCWHGQSDHYHLEDLERRVKEAVEGGIRKIYFRGMGGTSYYPSRFRPLYNGDHRANSAKLVKTIHTYDPLAEYCRVCAKYGVELYYWHTIFDNTGYFEYFPGMAEYEKFGRLPCGDNNLPDDFYTEHRKAYLPPQPLEDHIGLIILRSTIKTANARQLEIYTAADKQPFRRYEKPFQVATLPDGRGEYVVISGLDIAENNVKFGGDVAIGTDPLQEGCIRAYYVNGKPVEMMMACDTLVWGDVDTAHQLRGPGRPCRWGKNDGRTMVAHFGSFDRHALGVPDFAKAAARERVKNIVTELFDNYPYLSGVAFSIRTHSIPSPGAIDQLGYGDLYYGFSDPAVQRYQERYGTDPRRQPYDKSKFLKVRGEFFTETLGEVAAIAHPRGKKVECMAPIHLATMRDGCREGWVDFAYGNNFPWWRHTSIDDYFDIRTWAQKGYVDNVIMLGHALHQTAWPESFQKEASLFRERLAGTPTRLSLHVLANDMEPEEMKQFLPLVLKDPNLDEIEFYEEEVCHFFYQIFLDSAKAANRQIAPLKTP